MSEREDNQRQPGNRGVEEDLHAEGAGARSTETTPPIGDDAVKEQTQAPAPPDDVGVPSDEDMRRDDS